MKQKNYKLLIDPREQDDDRVNEIIDAFGEKNCLETHLWYGDYQVMDTATNRVVGAVEWKSAADFDASVASERVFNQAIDIAKYFPHHYVFIESDIKEYILKSDYIEEKDLKYRSLLGAIASLNQITTVVQNRNLQEAVIMLQYHMRKANDTHPRYLRHVRKDYDFLHTSLIAQPNIKYERAKLLIEELNLKSLDDLTNTFERNFKGIKGVGPRLTDTLMQNIHGEDYKTHNLTYDVDIREEVLNKGFISQFRENQMVKFIQQPNNLFTKYCKV
jgi:ERCC4-type nuclease